MTKSKKFGRKFFWSESIQNALKRILKQKSQNRKFFPVQNFFVGLSHILPKMTKQVKKLLSQKILVEKNFLVGNDSECFETYFKTKISKSKFFSHYKLFVGLSHFLPKMTQIVENDSQKVLVEL